MKSSSVILYCNRPPVTENNRGAFFIDVWISTLQPFIACEFLIDSRLRHVIAFEQIEYWNHPSITNDTSKYGNPGESFENVWPINVVEHPKLDNDGRPTSRLRVFWNAKFGKLLLTTIPFVEDTTTSTIFPDTGPWGVHTQRIKVASFPVNMEDGSTPGWNNQPARNKFSFYPNLRAVKVVNDQYQLMKHRVINIKDGTGAPPDSAVVEHGYDQSNYTSHWRLIPTIAPDESELCYGDVDGNGTLNVLDVIQLVNFILGDHDFDEEQIEIADVNRDGNIDILDVVQLVNTILNGHDCNTITGESQINEL